MLQHERHLTEVSRAISRRVISTPIKMFKDIALKREDCQTSGSFKWRGVQAQISMINEKPQGVVCVSTGNTGKAVALAGETYGFEAHVFSAGPPVIDKQLYIEKRGGIVHSGAASFSAAAVQAADFAKRRNMVFCLPGSSWQFIYGVATIVPEILQYDSDVTTIFAPIGGGGLVTALGLALRIWGERKPRLIGVQAANSPYVYYSYYGINEAPKVMPTVADCLSGDLEHDAIVLTVMHDVLDDIILVSEDEMVAAAADLKSVGVMAEPGAAAALAAARISTTHSRKSDRLCAIVSGGM